MRTFIFVFDIIIIHLMARFTFANVPFDMDAMREKQKKTILFSFVFCHSADLFICCHSDCSRSLFHCILYDSAVTNDSQRPIQMCPIIVRRNCAIDFANAIEMDIDFLSDFSTSVHFSPRSTSSYSLLYGATFCVCAFNG